ncbi:FtsX-like permease family protein [Kineosporia sp. NBRC 101731]|uniref:FtsX-like permease family protein n=1 Tax=Kineosporia sp. NBRC 101731 TaxID=3032199 RepID=UPI0024A482BC|nr:FtsX-like permease family protein [Kineosporia sp. NBRC 101731]GLY33831.1 hypothetical protein Kisp02_71960 [Kineosporia sp. NBRC 101731]
MSTGASSIFWQLSRPRSAADRQRARRMAFGVAGSGALLLGALAILTLRVGTASSYTCDDSGCYTDLGVNGPPDGGLAPYVVESGLRGGTAIGAVLLVVPFVLLALQALRTGTAARERRLAALSLAGATRRDLRRLAFLEGTRAAVIGALAAGPLYLLLWLVLGPALPIGSKMLPQPEWPILVGWLVMVAAAFPLGGLVAAQAARPAAVSPLGLTRRQQRPLTSAHAVAPVVSAGLIAIFLWRSSFMHQLGVGGAAAATVALAISSGPWVILFTGWLAARRRGLVTSMAGRRLMADVRTPGRVVGVMLAVGISYGIIATLVVDVTGPDAHDQKFYLVGMAGAAVAVAVAAVVATFSLVVGATEQVLDNARATAILVALAASPAFVSKIVRRQMLLAAVPATVLGAVLGWLVFGVLVVGSEDEGVGPKLAVALPAAMAAAALSATVGALVAALAVRPTIRSSSGPENLRTP